MEKINFNIDDIKNCADNLITYKRGLNYYRDNMVGKLSIKRINKEEILGF